MSIRAASSSWLAASPAAVEVVVINSSWRSKRVRTVLTASNFLSDRVPEPELLSNSNHNYTRNILLNFEVIYNCLNNNIFISREQKLTKLSSPRRRALVKLVTVSSSVWAAAAVG
jgi:hypothetical protein